MSLDVRRVGPEAAADVGSPTALFELHRGGDVSVVTGCGLKRWAMVKKILFAAGSANV